MINLIVAALCFGAGAYILSVGRDGPIAPLLFFVGINFAMGTLNLALGIATLT